MQTIIPYIIRSDSSKTPCPHGMKATCDNYGFKKPHLVHVGSWMEKDCPFLSKIKAEYKELYVILFQIHSLFIIQDNYGLRSM